VLTACARGALAPLLVKGCGPRAGTDRAAT
jgi:hypothetical protein